ncbi:peptidase family M3 [Penicillium verhagenii]|uniref:peptidase family M3 n=1 Tax=Penicillium verhagenii TaxID=1562060 RepID=UPI002545B582|nr:peptidase family M3 [Penicillium verhagenii]KAJ5947263.1 peptidase family M3 [Penicillium verhagenii]
MSLPQPLPRVPTAEEVVPSMQKIIYQWQTLRDQILKTTTPSTATFSNTMLPLAQLENALGGETGMIYMLQYGSPFLEVQEAFNRAHKLYLEALALWGADEPFFRLLQAAKEKPEFQTLDPESQHLLEKELLKYKHSGHGILVPEDVEVYLKRRTEIEELLRTFNQNVTMENGGVSFTLEELAGVPDDELAKWLDDSEGATDGHEKRKFVPFANGGTRAVLAYADQSETRKKMFLADDLKLEKNKTILEEIVKRRAKQAQMLKYPTHADFRIEIRMAKTTAWVKTFLSRLKETLVPLGRDEIVALQHRRLEDLQRREIQQVGDGFPPWDKSYYTRLVKNDLEIDHQKISEFFPLEQTASGMLNIFASLLGLRFDLIPSESLPADVLWHDAVQLYSVWDTHDDGFLGYLYLDLLWRENKYRGNQSVNIECGYLRPDGTRHCPSTILMCSFPAPNSKSCALLKHDQVVTLFHEMGHGIHDLLAKSKYSRFHGYRLPPDFGEMPSILLENWCWMKDVLCGLSCHYTTLSETYLADWRNKNPGSPDPVKTIPGHLVDSLIKNRYYNAGLYYLHQLTVSAFDFHIHSLGTDQDLADLDIGKLWYDLREELESMDFSECRSGFEFVTFSHLASGYDVGYYAYLCCTAMAQDLFLSTFAHDPYNKETWARYRRGILEYGGTQQDLLKMLESFLGRPPNIDVIIPGGLNTRGPSHLESQDRIEGQD